MTTAQALIVHVSFIVFVSSFASASRGLERISAVVGPSNSSVFGLRRIREFSKQITEDGNYAFDIFVLHENTSPNVKGNTPLEGQRRFVTVESENQIVTWLSRNKPHTILCFAQDFELPYSIVTARRKGVFSSNVRIISILEDVMNSQQKGGRSMDKIANVLLLSDLIMFTTARDQTFLNNELQNHKIDIPNGTLFKKVQSAVVLKHLSFIKEFVLASKPRADIGLDADLTKQKRVRRNIKSQDASQSSVNTTIPLTNATSVNTTVPPTNATSVNTTVLPTNATSVNTTVFPTNGTSVNTTVLPTNATSVNTTVPPTNATSVNTTVPPTNVTSVNTTVPPTNATSVNTTVPPTNATSVNTTVPSTNATSVNTTIPPTNATSVNTTIPPTNATSVNTTVPPTNATSVNTTIPPTNATGVNTTIPPTNATNVNTTVLPTNATNVNTTVLPTNATSVNTTVLPTNATNVNTTVLPTNATSVNTTVPPTNATSVNTTVPPTNATSVNTTVPPTNATSVNTTIPPTNATSVNTTVPPTNATSVNTTVPPTNATSVNTTVPPTNATSVNTTVPPTNATSVNTTVPPTNATSVNTTVPPTNATNVNTTVLPTNATSVNTTVPPTNATSVSTAIPPTNATSVNTTVPPTNATSVNTTVPPTNATSVNTTVPPTNATSVNTTVPPTNETSVSTTVPPTNATSVSTTIPPTNATSVSTTIPPTNATSVSTAIPPTNATSVSTTVPPTNATSVSTTVHPTNATSVSTTIPPTNATRPPTSSTSTTISTNVTSPKPKTGSTTASPPSKDEVSYIITLEGNCNEVLGKADIKRKFIEEFKKIIAVIIKTSESEIQVGELKCGSIKVSFVVKNAKKSNATEVLTKAASNGQIVVPVNGKNYTSSGLIVIPGPTTSPPKIAPTTKPYNKLALYLYIGFGSAMGLVFLIGLIVLITRCRRDRTRGSFVLGNDADVELKRYRGMPRASYYRVEMYGEPVEMDAARPGVTDDEYEGDIVPYAQTSFSNSTSTRPTSNNNFNKDEFSMGNLPEWNVPKLKTSDMVVSSSGAGQDEDEEGGEKNFNHDALHAYDNPVMTFKDTSNNSSE